MTNSNIVDFPRPDRSEEFLHWVRDETKDFSERYCALNQQALDAGDNTYYFVVNHRHAFQALFDEAKNYPDKLRRKAIELDVPASLVEPFISQMKPTLDKVAKDSVEMQQVLRVAEQNGHIQPARQSTPRYTPPSSRGINPALNRFNDPPLPSRAPPSRDWTLTFVVWGLIAFVAVIILAVANSNPSTTMASTYSPSASSSSSSSPSVWPYFWAGIHNGRVSHGFGVRGGGRRHH